MSLGEYNVDDDKYRSIKFDNLCRDRMEVQGGSITLVLCCVPSVINISLLSLPVSVDVSLVVSFWRVC